MTFTIGTYVHHILPIHSLIDHRPSFQEPIFVAGRPTFRKWADNWTLSTVDGSWSAQTEHTVLITDTGAEILTS
jgi:methionine aminopeptidase